jgi:hypothetical protein
VLNVAAEVGSVLLLVCLVAPTSRPLAILLANWPPMLMLWSHTAYALFTGGCGIFPIYDATEEWFDKTPVT